MKIDKFCLGDLDFACLLQNLAHKSKSHDNCRLMLLDWGVFEFFFVLVNVVFYGAVHNSQRRNQEDFFAAFRALNAAFSTTVPVGFLNHLHINFLKSILIQS